MTTQDDSGRRRVIEKVVPVVEMAMTGLDGEIQTSLGSGNLIAAVQVEGLPHINPILIAIYWASGAPSGEVSQELADKFLRSLGDTAQ